MALIHRLKDRGIVAGNIFHSAADPHFNDRPQKMRNRLSAGPGRDADFDLFCKRGQRHYADRGCEADRFDFVMHSVLLC